MSDACNEAGRFQSGHSGNPAGRRKGSKNGATPWAEARRRLQIPLQMQARRPSR